MKAVHFQALLPVLMLTVTQLAAAAADDYKVIKLEQDMRMLEQQVRELSRQVAELRRDAGRSAAPAPSLSSQEPPTSDSPPWFETKNWQRLQPGMTELQVIETLGLPTSIRGNAEAGARTLLYALEIGTGNFLSGSVQLRDRRVVEVSTPVLR